jgi:anti-anti-sigma factor
VQVADEQEQPRVDHYRVEITHTDDAAVVALEGELDLASRASLEATFARAIDREHVVVDLARVSFIDSTGIGVLLRAHRAATERGSSMTFLAGPPKVMRTLHMAGVTEQLGIVEPSD